MKLILFTLAACCLCAQAPRVLIENATLIDALGAPSVQGMQVLTQGDRIVSVAKRIRAPKGTQVVRRKA